MTLSLGVIAFLLSGIESYLAVRRMQSVHAGTPVQAANWDTVFGGFIGATVLLLQFGDWYLLPMLPGYWLGTYTAKRWP